MMMMKKNKTITKMTQAKTRESAKLFLAYFPVYFSFSLMVSGNLKCNLQLVQTFLVTQDLLCWSHLCNRLSCYLLVCSVLLFIPQIFLLCCTLADFSFHRLRSILMARKYSHYIRLQKSNISTGHAFLHKVEAGDRLLGIWSRMNYLAKLVFQVL